MSILAVIIDIATIEPFQLRDLAAVFSEQGLDDPGLIPVWVWFQPLAQVIYGKASDIAYVFTIATCLARRFIRPEADRLLTLAHR